MKKLRSFWSYLNAFKESHPDDARRGRILNVLLAGAFSLSILALVAVLILFSILSSWDNPGNSLLLITIVVLVIGSIGLFYINQKSTKSAALLFLMLLSVAFIFSDVPQELANGRSTFVFLITIAISSLLLTPASSFFFAIGNGVIITVLASISGVVPNVPAMVSFFMLALISWLSSRSLEQALHELRQINTNLDQIVKERTHALAQALTRERIEAGRSQAILESIADGVIVFDTQGNAIQANPALSNLINVPIDTIVNASVNHLVESSPMDAANKGTLAGVLTKPGKPHASHRVAWGEKTLSISSGQVLDRDGSEVGTVAVFRDFTREAEVEKMKSAFVAMVSHELRTPISAILGYAEIFREQIYGPLNEKQVQMTSRIISNSSRLLSLINDLLDQAQMEAGKLKIKYEVHYSGGLVGKSSRCYG